MDPNEYDEEDDDKWMEIILPMPGGGYFYFIDKRLESEYLDEDEDDFPKPQSKKPTPQFWHRSRSQGAEPSKEWQPNQHNRTDPVAHCSRSRVPKKQELNNADPKPKRSTTV